MNRNTLNPEKRKSITDHFVDAFRESQPLAFLGSFSLILSSFLLNNVNNLWGSKFATLSGICFLMAFLLYFILYLRKIVNDNNFRYHYFLKCWFILNLLSGIIFLNFAAWTLARSDSINYAVFVGIPVVSYVLVSLFKQKFEKGQERS